MMLCRLVGPTHPNTHLTQRHEPTDPSSPKCPIPDSDLINHRHGPTKEGKFRSGPTTNTFVSYISKPLTIEKEHRFHLKPADPFSVRFRQPRTDPNPILVVATLMGPIETCPFQFLSSPPQSQIQTRFASLPKTHLRTPPRTGLDFLARFGRTGSFLDLKPESKPESLDFNLAWLEPAEKSRFDVLVIGSGPAGLRLADQVARYGIRVCVIDPSPLATWPNNYGVWVDEFESIDLADCLDKTWPMACVHIDRHKTKYLDRPYGRVNRNKLKTRFLERCVSNGVKFHKAKVWKLVHSEFESLAQCDDGSEIKASLVVDASGFTSNFTEYDQNRNVGFQIAHGILAEVEDHPFDLDKMVLMDWSDTHLGNEPYLRENNEKLPTFLYAMPFDSNLVFLEETSLVSRPALPYKEVKTRMVARLRHLGIKVKRVIEHEKCLIPMGGPLPRIPQNVLSVGGTGGMVHPSTGYSVARTLELVPSVAAAIAESLGSTRMIRGRAMHDRVWNGTWTAEMRREREFYKFGMETLLRLDLDGTRRFFDAFFDLDPRLWHGFLSSRLSAGELVGLGLSLFGCASYRSKVDIVTKCPSPLVRMMGNLALEVI